VPGGPWPKSLLVGWGGLVTRIIPDMRTSQGRGLRIPDLGFRNRPENKSLIIVKSRPFYYRARVVSKS